MAQLTIDIPLSLKEALEKEARKNSVGLDGLVASILSEHMRLSVHTVFQVSTSGALVAGVFEQEVTVGTLLEHGNLGLGTFAGLDGEMVVLDGRVYQAHGSGQVTEAKPDAGVPFAVITDFAPDKAGTITGVASFGDLEAHCDAFRTSDNIFYAFRLNGHFSHIKIRAANPAAPGATLAEATKSQSEFVLDDLAGTLVGIWSPSFSSAFSVEGYHFHFISDDRQHGGHVLAMKAEMLDVAIEALTDFRLVLPETEAYLKAKLHKDSAAELDAAEHDHSPGPRSQAAGQLTEP